MRHRAYIHIDGAPGSGKTIFIERLLAAGERFLPGVVRCERVAGLKACQESHESDDVELHRYRESGVMFAARFRFPPDVDDQAFWSTRFIEEFSKAIVIEGDLPDGVHPDLAVYVARPLPEGEPLVCRVTRSAPLPDRKILALFGLTPERLARPEERWGVRDGHEGIERAQVVVVNVRKGEDHKQADRLVEELGRLRADKVLFKEVVPWHGSRLPITAMVADLSDPKDAGLKKALARIKRTMAAEAKG
jgi:hypothetical protein